MLHLRPWAHVEGIVIAAVLIAIAASLPIQIAQAHYDHQAEVQVTWSSIDLEGTREPVHDPYTNYWESSATSWVYPADHYEDLQATVYWAERFCLGFCWWDTNGSQSSGRVDSTLSALTDTLSFTASDCSDYKFYSKHWNYSHNSSAHNIDEAEGVQPFTSGNC